VEVAVLPLEIAETDCVLIELAVTFESFGAV
jgi:hypothetical protein